MTDDVRAAVGRVRRWYSGEWLAGEWLAGIYPEAKDRSQELALLETDWRDVAIAYLTEHPADDGDPVDEAWLRAVGFGVYGLFADRDGGLSIGDLEWHECRRWLYGNTPLPDLPTRGHVRRLCLALGIPLTETRQ